MGAPSAPTAAAVELCRSVSRRASQDAVAMRNDGGRKALSVGGRPYRRETDSASPDPARRDW